MRQVKRITWAVAAGCGIWGQTVAGQVVAQTVAGQVVAQTVVAQTVAAQTVAAQTVTAQTVAGHRLAGDSATAAARAADPVPPADIAALAPEVDAVVSEWLATTGAPSVSIAIVRHGALVYARAYGLAQLDPPTAALPASRYAIDSLTKEFTAAAVLLLAEQGKLALDERVSRWFPDLGDAGRVTLRQLLTHTSGIRDYWPQDFVTPEMTRTTTPAALVQEWVKRPLDFAPGTEWQYSNTGYVLAAEIIEQASGEEFFAFLRRHIFAPLRMASVSDDTSPRGAADAAGYTRYGLGPARPAPQESPRWLFGAANLVMQASDIGLWDVSVMDRSLLRARSYAAEWAPVVLKNRTTVPYGLGLDVEHVDGRLRLGHAGGGSGFLADNRLWPQERDAIVVLTNNDWASPADLTRRIAFLMLTPSPAAARARAVFAALQGGSIDRSLFTDIGNAYFTDEVVADLHATLSSLGPARDFVLDQESKRGGMTTRHWKILCRSGRLEATERIHESGRLDEFLITQRQD